MTLNINNKSIIKLKYTKNNKVKKLNDIKNKLNKTKMKKIMYRKI